MNWSRQQQQAIDAVGKWLLATGGQQVFRLFGYAGTGKSTLAKHLADGFRAVEFAAYTGKAAHVMQTKGCEGAQTIHSLIYHPREKSKMRLKELQQEHTKLQTQARRSYGGLKSQQMIDLEADIKAERENLNRPSFVLNEESSLRDADLLIIDECSMVGASMAEDLMHFGTPILALGDPAQLPPVGEAGFFTNEKPDVLLTEIHRQARDNPIIGLATAVREGRGIDYGHWGESSVITPEEYRRRDDEIDPTSVQVIVGKNATRWRANKKIRHNYFGWEDDWRSVPTLSQNEKLVCLQNDHNLGILNGSIWWAGTDPEGEDLLELQIRDDDDSSREVEVAMHTFYFDRTYADVPKDVAEPSYHELTGGQCFDYGYALTAHKAQGSSWEEVVVVDEAWGSKRDRERWLYTAITRASKRVTVVRRS